MDLDDFQDMRGRLGELVSTLGVEQLRFVSARLNAKNDREAAEAIGISPATVYSWSKGDKETIAEVQRLMVTDAAISALAYFRRYVLEAAVLKVRAMMGDKEVHDKFVQDAATEVLDRVLGKPRQQVEVSGDGDAFVPKTYVTVSPDMWDKD